MEEILLKLLVVDNTSIQQGTAELREAIRKPESTPALCQLIVSSSNPQIRQYAAVLLRKWYNKGKYWQSVPQYMRTEFKVVILQALVNEPEKFVKNSIAQLIGVIIKHELPNNGWPEVLQFVQQLVVSENLLEKELGTYTLSIITEIAPATYNTHAKSLAGLLQQTLNGLQDLGSPVAYYIIKIMQNLVKDNKAIVSSYNQMMPQVMTVIQCLATTQEDRAVECFELLEELCASANVLIAPHVKPLIRMCFAIAGNKSLQDAVRVKALEIIGWLARKKQKDLVEHKLIEPILDLLFNLISTKPDDNKDEVYFCSDNEDDTLIVSALETIDILALHFPSEKVLPPLLQYIEHSLQGTDVYAKRASYSAMAVLAEGCSEYIRTKYLESFLRCICQGITDPIPVVRNAAFFALEKFSTHLESDVLRFAPELLPVLFEYLGQICAYIKQEKQKPTSVKDAFLVLEMFCKNLKEGFSPYVPTFMERLFEIFNTDTPPYVRECAITAIDAAANGSKENVLPYFPRIFYILNGYLKEQQTDETRSLQINAVYTLGVIIRTVGDQNFTPLAGETLNSSMQLLRETDDPNLKKCIYGLFAEISAVMKKKMAAALPEIIDSMITSIRSSEGIVPHFKGDESFAFPIYEDLSDHEDENDEEDIENTDNEEDEDDDDDDAVVGYSVERAYIQEKMTAVEALEEIAKHTEEAFLPYLEKSFEETFKLLNYPPQDIRTVALKALLQFCINLSKINTNEGKAALLKALSVVVPKLSELIRLDEERSVAFVGLIVYSILLQQIGKDVLTEDGHTDAILNCITDVMRGRTQCQDQEEAEDEQDKQLVEYAGILLSNMGKLMPPEDFAIHYRSVLPILIEILKKDKPKAQRNSVVATIAECFKGLKYMAGAFLPELLPLLFKFANDPSVTVRYKAISGIVTLVIHGGESVYLYYPAILKHLLTSVVKESDARVHDNILAAIARLIITNYSIIPLDQVFPVFVNQLPLKKDFEQNQVVFASILKLYYAGLSILEPQIYKLLKVAVSILQEGTATDDGTKSIVRQFIQCVRQDFPDRWSFMYTSII